MSAAEPPMTHAGDRAVGTGWRRRQWLGSLPLILPALYAATWVAASPADTDVDAAWSALDWVQGSPVRPGNGRPMVLVFWATWCAYCRRHNAHIDRLHAQVQGRMDVVGIAVESDILSVRRHLQASGHRFPVAVDAGALRRRYTERRLVPMTCTIDRRGRTGLCIPGEMSLGDVLDLARAADQPER
jgi:thiol-disulfide isomerase/thioredoxin